MNSSLAKFPLLLSMGEGEEWEYVRDGIISRSIGTIGKLKRVQSKRDGGANVALKNLHDY